MWTNNCYLFIFVRKTGIFISTYFRAFFKSKEFWRRIWPCATCMLCPPSDKLWMSSTLKLDLFCFASYFVKDLILRLMLYHCRYVVKQRGRIMSIRYFHKRICSIGKAPEFVESRRFALGWSISLFGGAITSRKQSNYWLWHSNHCQGNWQSSYSLNIDDATYSFLLKMWSLPIYSNCHRTNIVENRNTGKSNFKMDYFRSSTAGITKYQRQFGKR